MRQRNIACGCVLGGALGDALGYPVEFLSYKEILKKYPQGIQELELEKGRARISDDTQMLLYTLEALLYHQGEIISSFYDYYLDWAWTQLLSINSKISLLHPSVSKLPYIEEMRCSRAPGNTCINSLLSGKMGTLENPLNHSKGCGDIMRVAPIGLYYG